MPSPAGTRKKRKGRRTYLLIHALTGRGYTIPPPAEAKERENAASISHLDRYGYTISPFGIKNKP
jgi:hypothetical protein